MCWAIIFEQKYPEVVRMLVRWLRDASPGFAGTSVTLNSGFSARRRRGTKNRGLPAVKTFGAYDGGRLLSCEAGNRERDTGQIRKSCQVELSA